MKYKTSIEDMDLSKVPFANHVLEKFDAHQYESLGSENGSVNLSRVIGCHHPDYAGKTWGELKPVPGSRQGDRDDFSVAYQSLKRAIGNIRELERNPDYYLSKNEKDHWSFYDLQGNIYISSGVHRTVIGRYFFFLNEIEPIIHGVNITYLKPKKVSTDKSNEKPKQTLIEKLIKLITQHNTALQPTSLSPLRVAKDAAELKR